MLRNFNNRIINAMQDIYEFKILWLYIYDNCLCILVFQHYDEKKRKKKEEKELKKKTEKKLIVKHCY